MPESPTREIVSPDNAAAQASLAELALVFLKLGTIAFGGPAAHIAMMQEQFVRKWQWITQADFLDRLGAANLIPGPSSTEVAIFIGHAKRGWAGLVVAGCCFIIPAAVMVTLIAAVYVKYWVAAAGCRNFVRHKSCGDWSDLAGAVELGTDGDEDEAAGVNRSGCGGA